MIGLSFGGLTDSQHRPGDVSCRAGVFLGFGPAAVSRRLFFGAGILLATHFIILVPARHSSAERFR